MWVSVDHEFCESAGVCRHLVPDLFVAAEDGTTQVVGDIVPSHLEDDVRLAADSCPRLALVVED